MIREAIAVSLILMPTPALAEWRVEQQGTKVMSHRNDPVGTIARLRRRHRAATSRPICKSNASSIPRFRESTSEWCFRKLRRPVR